MSDSLASLPNFLPIPFPASRLPSPPVDARRGFLVTPRRHRAACRRMGSWSPRILIVHTYVTSTVGTVFVTNLYTRELVSVRVSIGPGEPALYPVVR